MKQSVNELLREKLLITPAPICNKREFNFYYERMFEGKDAYINFLNYEDPKQKASEAIRIISRLAYNSNFPPAIKLLDNLRDFENDLSNEEARTISHVSRDHYIHLCYLYLIGLYIFFYDPIINQKLLALFAQTRFSSDVSSASSAVKSFLSGWKYFVLYHDIAYPLEYFGFHKHTYSESEKGLYAKYVKELDFQNIQKNITNMFACRSMATILAISDTVTSGSNQKFLTFQRFFKNYYQHTELLIVTYKSAVVDLNKKEAYDSILSHRKVVSLDRIVKGDDIKYILTALTSNDLIVILREKGTNNFLGVYYGPDRWFMYNKSDANTILIRKIVKDPNVIFNDEFYIKHPKVLIEYYAPDADQKIESYFSSLRISGLNIPYCKNVISKLNVSSKFSRIDEFAQYCFDTIYERLFRFQNNVSNDFINAANAEEYVLRAIIDAIKPKISKKISEAYNRIKKSNPDLWGIGNCSDTIQKIVKPAVMGLSTISANVTNASEIIKICENVSEKLFEKRNELNDIIDFFSKTDTCLRSTMILVSSSAPTKSLSKLIDCSEDGLLALRSEVCKGFLSDVLPLISDVIEDYIEASTSKRISLEDLILAYECPYSLFDHGISALFIFNEHIRNYRSWIELIIKDYGSSSYDLLKLSLRLPRIDNSEETMKEKYITEYDYLIPEIAYALVNHNLYPNYFNKRKVSKFTNNLDTNTFSYFCMICDAIQEWGRSPLINVGRESFPKKIFDAATTSVKIQDSIIEVHIDRSNVHMSSTEIKTIEDNFKQYLQDSDSFIRFFID